MKSGDLVRINEIQEHKHENSRVWKSKQYIELQNLMDSIRKKEVDIIFITPNKSGVK